MKFVEQLKKLKQLSQGDYVSDIDIDSLLFNARDSNTAILIENLLYFFVLKINKNDCPYIFFKEKNLKRKFRRVTRSHQRYDMNEYRISINIDVLTNNEIKFDDSDNLLYDISDFFKTKCMISNMLMCINVLVSIKENSPEFETHANMLIINPRNSTIERFEPHGAKTLLYDVHKMNILFQDITKKISYYLGKTYNYIPPIDFCPEKKYGIQDSENFNTRDKIWNATGTYLHDLDTSGYCYIFSIMMMDFRLKNPELEFTSENFGMTDFEKIHTFLYQYLTFLIRGLKDLLLLDKEMQLFSIDKSEILSFSVGDRVKFSNGEPEAEYEILDFVDYTKVINIYEADDDFVDMYVLEDQYNRLEYVSVNAHPSLRLFEVNDYDTRMFEITKSKIHGLQKRPELNGKNVRLVGFDYNRGRYNVVYDYTGDVLNLGIQPKNLKLYRGKKLNLYNISKFSGNMVNMISKSDITRGNSIVMYQNNFYDVPSKWLKKPRSFTLRPGDTMAVLKERHTMKISVHDVKKLEHIHTKQEFTYQLEEPVQNFLYKLFMKVIDYQESY